MPIDITPTCYINSENVWRCASKEADTPLTKAMTICSQQMAEGPIDPEAPRTPKWDEEWAACKRVFVEWLKTERGKARTAYDARVAAERKSVNDYVKDLDKVE